MKKGLLLALSLYCSATVFAQTSEFGIGGGFSTNSSPTDNMEYKGDQMLMNYSGTLKVLFTGRTGWQYGFDGHILELASKSSKKYGGFYNDELYIPSVGGDGKKLVYAKYATSFCAVLNRLMPVGPDASFYIGAAVGYGFARNNSKRYLPNESYKAPDGGEGMVYGLQLGYRKNISEGVVFNIEGAMRAFNLGYDAEAPQRPYHEVLRYSVVSFPVTVGLRFLIFHGDENKALRGMYNIRRNKYY